MQAHEHAVFRHTEILLDVIGGLGNGELVCVAGVLGRVRGRTAVGDELLRRRGRERGQHEHGDTSRRERRERKTGHGGMARGR